MNAQQLKNSILQEAIEGRLVPQDPNDEPASVLLDKIRKEKAKLVKEGKLKKKDLEETSISEDEILFKIPESWRWCRLNDICIFLSRGKSPTYSAIPNEYPVFAQKCNLKNGGISLEHARFLSPETALKWQEEFHLRTDDVLVNSTGTGTVCRTRLFHESYLGNYPFTVPDSHVSVVRTSENICSAFIFNLFNSKIYQDYWEDRLAGSTNQKELYIGVLQNTIIPLPPLAEQKHIVAKIEELLPKVEEYGKAQEALDKLNEELPERLKKSILQEAIEGRLVPQDPNDEPASVLLDKIRKEKAKLVKEGKLKKKDLEETPISEDEIPFRIPESWEWTRLGNHISATSGLAYKKDDLAIYSNEYVRVLRGGNISFGSWYVKDDDVMIGKQFVNDELILKKGMFISPAVTSLEHMGKTALIREDQNNVVAGGFVLMLIPFFNNEIYWEYLNVFFQSGYYRDKCKSITNKSGQAFFNLSRAKLLNLPIPLPPLAEQKRIVAKIEQLMKEINKLKV